MALHSDTHKFEIFIKDIGKAQIVTHTNCLKLSVKMLLKCNLKTRTKHRNCEEEGNVL